MPRTASCLYLSIFLAVTSPGNNQNAAAVAAAAAVLAAVNTANPDSHNVSSRPPSVPAVPSRPASLHSKDPRSPSTSIISDHKSESGGSGINDIRATPSPVMSLTRNTPQNPNEHSTQLNLPMDFETGYMLTEVHCENLFIKFFCHTLPKKSTYVVILQRKVILRIVEACFLIRLKYFSSSKTVYLSLS